MGSKTLNIIKKWITITHIISNEGKCLNWVDIFSLIIIYSLKFSLSSPPTCKQILYMSFYLIDIGISSVPLPHMKWNDQYDQELPIQNYAYIVCELNFKFHIYGIFRYFLICFYEILFGKVTLRISQNQKEGLDSIRHWFVEDSFSYNKKKFEVRLVLTFYPIISLKGSP